MATQKRIKHLLTFLLLLTLYRGWVLYNSGIDLYMDEAYYWGWSKSFEFGYYSKPPMIAWVIGVFTQLCSDHWFCVKLPALILHPVTSVVIYLISKELFDEETGFWSAITYITLPSVSLSSMIISTDVLLLLFWSLTMLMFVKAIKTDNNIYWFGAALAAGCGLLSKYTMIIFLPSVFLYLAFSNRHRAVLKNPKLYLTLIIAALIYIPNLIWNYNHHFVSFMHTKEISEIERDLFHPEKMIEFLAAQFAVFGPVTFGALIYLLFKRSLYRYENYKLLYVFTFTFLGLITLQALLSRAFANWAAPSYVAATVLVASYLYREKRTLLKAAIAINIGIAVMFYHYHSIAKILDVELTSKTDPYKRVLGWSSLAQEVEKILKAHPGYKLLCDDREIMAQLVYYIKPHPFDAGYWNMDGSLSNHYELTIDMNEKVGENFILVTKRSSIGDIASKFESVKKLGTIKIRLYKDYVRVYHLYALENFKGY